MAWALLWVAQVLNVVVEAAPPSAAVLGPPQLVLIVAAIVLLLRGCLQFPVATVGLHERLRLIVDLGIAFMSVCPWLLVAFVVPSIARHEPVSTTAAILAVPSLESALLVTLLFVVLRSQRQVARAVGLLAIGILLEGAGEVVADYSAARNGSAAATPTLALILFALMIACGSVSMLLFRADVGDVRLFKPRPSSTYRYLPYCLAGFALVSQPILLLRAEDRPTTVGLVVLGAVTMLLVLVRQALVLRESAELSRELFHHAYRDPLTMLPNRRSLSEFFGTLREVHADAPRAVAIALLDVDHFKLINDTHGHAVGDAALVWTAQQCAARLRAKDMLARLGGDEFVMLLPDTDEDGLSVILREILAVMRQPDSNRGGVPRVSVSIGAVIADTTRGLDEVLLAADKALYEAKNAGRDRAYVSALPTDRADRHQLEGAHLLGSEAA